MAADKSKSLIMAQRLKNLRTERGLSHESLRKALMEKYEIDISIDSLKNYEVSKAQHAKAYKNEGMRVEYLRCLADFYGVSSDYLLGFSDDPSPGKRAVDDLGFSPEVVSWFIELRDMHGAFGIADDIFQSIAFQLLVESLCDYYNSKLAEFIYNEIFLKHFPDLNDVGATQEQIDNFYDDVGRDETRKKFEKPVTDFLHVQRLIWDRDPDSSPLASVATQGEGFTVSELAEYRAEKHLKSTFEGIGYYARDRFDRVVGENGND